MTLRKQIIDEARTWLGVPWRHLGRNRAGIDCIGLGIEVCKAVGLSNYDVPAYGRESTPALMAGVRKAGIEIPIKELQPGDFVVIKDGPYPFHVAFYSHKKGVPHLIHAHARRRKVVEELYAHEWNELVVHAFQIRGVN